MGQASVPAPPGLLHIIDKSLQFACQQLVIFPEFLVRIKAIGKFCRITNQRRELRIAVFRWAGVGGPTKFCVGASVRAADFSTAATVCDNLVAVGMLELEPNPHPQVGGKAPALPLPVQAAAATRAGKTSAAAHGRTSGGRPPNPSAPHAGARFFRARGFLGPWDPENSTLTLTWFRVGIGARVRVRVIN